MLATAGVSTIAPWFFASPVFAGSKVTRVGVGIDRGDLVLVHHQHREAVDRRSRRLPGVQVAVHRRRPRSPAPCRRRGRRARASRGSRAGCGSAPPLRTFTNGVQRLARERRVRLLGEHPLALGVPGVDLALEVGAPRSPAMPSRSRSPAAGEARMAPPKFSDTAAGGERAAARVHRQLVAAHGPAGHLGSVALAARARTRRRCRTPARSGCRRRDRPAAARRRRRPPAPPGSPRAGRRRGAGRRCGDPRPRAAAAAPSWPPPSRRSRTARCSAAPCAVCAPVPGSRPSKAPAFAREARAQGLPRPRRRAGRPARRCAAWCRRTRAESTFSKSPPSAVRRSLG